MNEKRIDKKRARGIGKRIIGNSYNG